MQTEFFGQLQQKDSESWSTLMSRYAPQLRRDITCSLNKRNLPLKWVEDIEQETWLTVVRRIDNFVWQSEDKFYNWFRSIATYHIKTLERTQKDVVISLEDIDAESEDTGLSVDFIMYAHGQFDQGPEAIFALRESLELLEAAMQMLKPREREILCRRILYNESVQDIAATYQVKPETVSVILVRAKKAIATQICILNNHARLS